MTRERTEEENEPYGCLCTRHTLYKNLYKRCTAGTSERPTGESRGGSERK